MEKNEIVLYQPDNTISLEVRMQNETVWLTQSQIAVLFGTKRPAITKHLNNIYNDGELDKGSTCSILEHIGNDGRRLYHTAYFDAYVFAADLIRSAKERIILIDNYINESVLLMLSKRNKFLVETILTCQMPPFLSLFG